MNAFENSLQHILAELERIDLLIAAQVARARQLCAADEQFRGLYISEDDVNALINQPNGVPRWVRGEAPLAAPPSLENVSRLIESRKKAALDAGVRLRLHDLQQKFGLSRLEVDTLLVCLAAEIDLRYERLYAYLHDDVTRKRPTIDLVLSLLTSSIEEKFACRCSFAETAALFRHLLLEQIDDTSQPHLVLLAKALKIDPRIAGYLFGSDELDSHIQSYAALRASTNAQDTLLVDRSACEAILQFIRDSKSAGESIIYIHGPYGVGRRSTAEAVCRASGLQMLIIDLERLSSEPDSSIARALRLIEREAKLQGAAMYWHGIDSVLPEDKKPLLRTLLAFLAQRQVLTFIGGEQFWQPADAFSGAPFVRLELRRPPFSERSRIWSAALNGSQPVNGAMDVAALASKFKFTGGQIRDVAATARNLARIKAAPDGPVTMSELYEASRLHSNHRLSVLARKITPRYRWEDIVLPDDRLEQLREIFNHVKYRDQVYGAWGFDRKLSLGKGLNLLFAGPSGTGKTMAADIIAGELGLDLYKIDLSTVVSKYIGETEKNLSRIFAEAETSNAILFFDEADALFGKRSEVKDAHDRYANIEVGYLLQRMEEYEGMVILATNFRKNMDEAFVRRLHFTVEFPYPKEDDRRRIWHGVWPDDTPRHADVDLEFMARRFELTGGNIRNIAVAAAFIAADHSGPVTMKDLIRATQREYQKMGKVVSDAHFDLQAGSAGVPRSH